MKIIIDLSLLVSCFLLLSCASTSSPQARPKWVDNAYSVYLQRDYLTAVGQASTRERAADNAMANLAEIFMVNVHAETNTLTQVKKQQSALGATAESSTILERKVNTQTQQMLSGVVIKESWLSARGEYYALAVLNKRKAALSLTESILEMDKLTAELLDYSAKRAANVIAALNALRNARDLQLRRAIANLKLKQVSERGIPNEIASAKIEQLITEKLASLQVTVIVDSDTHMKNLQSALSQLGVQVVEHSDLQLSADMDISKPEFINNWYWLRGSYVLNLLQGGHVVSSKRWPVKVSAKQQAQLIPRLQDKINSNIADYLSALLSDSTAH